MLGGILCKLCLKYFNYSTYDYLHITNGLTEAPTVIKQIFIYMNAIIKKKGTNEAVTYSITTGQ